MKLTESPEQDRAHVPIWNGSNLPSCLLLPDPGICRYGTRSDPDRAGR